MIYFRAISGGVTAPRGFKAGGIHCGLKLKKGELDLALIYSDVPCIAAGVFTNNRVQAAPIKITKGHIKRGRAQAIIANSGNANCSTGKSGIRDARKTVETTALELGIDERLVMVASTGIIGKPLPIDKIVRGIPMLIRQLSDKGSRFAARAIMTTDTRPKEIAVSLKIGRHTITIGGIAKGAGMIHPRLATMLAFITTDASIEHRTLKEAFKTAAEGSFNCITVDGCTSTNDTALILANGLANNRCINLGRDKDKRCFSQGLNYVCNRLSKMIIEDAEGGTKFIRINVRGAKNDREAKRIAIGVANSNLVKSAIFGEDKNIGRIIAAVGASGAYVKDDKLKIETSSFRNRRVDIDIDLNISYGRACVFTSDLSCEYVRLNARKPLSAEGGRLK